MCSHIRGGGLAGTVWFELPACYHPNLGIFWGVWLFQKNFRKKKHPTPVKSLFENTMGNPFFYFVKYWTKLLIFFFRIEILGILFSNLHWESIFDFRKWSNGKYTNTRICVFSVWPLPEVENWFRKQIWKENAHISIQFFFFEEFRSIFKKKVKKWISHRIFKKWFDRRRVFFFTKIFLKKPNTPKYA